MYAVRGGRLLPWRWMPSLMLALAMCIIWQPAARADSIAATQLAIEYSPEGYRLGVVYNLTLNHSLRSALERGVPLYFTMEAQVRRPRWYWFDAVTASATRTTRIAYNVLTGQYSASTAGLLQLNFPTLEEAMAMVLRPSRWLIMPADALRSGQTYTVSTRLMLDVSQLPKPFQINAINDSDWNLSSDWASLEITPG